MSVGRRRDHEPATTACIVRPAAASLKRPAREEEHYKGVGGEDTSGVVE